MEYTRETVLPALEGMKTKAAKIRALAFAGYLRSEIAEIVGVRYQRVRNTLEAAGISLGKTRDVVLDREPVEIEVAEEEIAEARPTAASYLLAGGAFRPAGEWRLAGEGLELSETAPKETGVYAFILDGSIAYVGLTLRTLHQRLSDYRRGHARQRTSARVKKQIIESLRAGSRVEVLVATPEATEWRGLPALTAAGLEAALIRKLLPPWNVHGVSAKA